ncbi:Fructose-1,6-bisphosphatase class 1 1 [Gracilariopsis chorda]|uniref:Fructose-1,6-bisphosphatase class 1 1 n=1 Tax=Gracilariopsis chorda TaxID=448386 RepID=A0A2V3IWX8_9FLOR|nr:Fructose-1,6-bisphosphatase class 1 1 [Gracilariopsis chorda]|eukprot:PXF46656.1 Fructose-1,6-bisphosphatase class 1 1 [Gracilariopsis chorda]
MPPEGSSGSLTSSLISLTLETARDQYKQTGAKKSAPLCTPPLSPLTPEPEFCHTTAFQTATFPSHVRAYSSRAKHDSPGELVRLLDDISTASHSISSYVSRHHHDDQGPSLDPLIASKRLHSALCHDGYACLILDKEYDRPLTFCDSALHGPYVVMITPLDIDPSEQHLMCGTLFSVYKRTSSPSVSGRLEDLCQKTVDQIAAGYIMYASATTLQYTLGKGVHSFCLHPVATQFFLNPSKPLRFAGKNDLYCDYAVVKSDATLGTVTTSLVKRLQGRIYDNGCFVADFDGAVRSGGIVLWYNLHLFCEAAPMAFLAEQMGGRAVDAQCNRILGKFITICSAQTAAFLLSCVILS